MELVAPVDSQDHQLGPVDARVVVVEYGDFECPNCKQAAPAVEMLLNRFAGQVRFVYRHYPLEQVHRHALLAAETAECAAVEGRFWEMHRLLFENQQALDSANLFSYARRVGLDAKKYSAQMADHVHLSRIHRDIDSGLESGVRSTPGFFIDGMRQDVSFGLHLLFDATAAALSRK